MNDSFLETILGKDRSMTDEVQIGILDKKGNLCADWCPKGTKISDAVKQEVYKISAQETSGILAKSRRVSGGVCSIYKESSSEMTVFTVVPSSVMTQGTMRVLTVLIGIYLFVAVVAVVLSIYFSKRFTSPIREISEEMTQFDGNDFSRLIELNTNTELDQIGHSYNKMLKNIENLLAEIKEQEGVLRRTELNMLLAQINPHFLYNTLESIRMKAFTVGDREVANAIKLLGKSMRYVLENNGTTFTALKNELNHIETYIMIQKMRFGDKFNYELCVDDDIDTEQCRILPLLLQPIVENALVHGLEEKEEGGMITLQVERCGGSEDIRITISDNGCGMDEATLAQLRRDIEEKNPEKKESIGLYNINQRIKLCYGEQYGMAVQSELEKGTAVSITISMKTQQFV